MSEQTGTDLKDFVDKHAQTSHLRVEKDLGGGFFRLRPGEAQRRQAQQDIRSVEDAVIELLRNSRDAGASNIYLATNTEDAFRHILVIDDGSGVPKGHQKVIFEPYVTSKLDTMTTDT
ncbi:MAG: ATP-binding protein [Coriobacteriia bacterium]|nr:ATP-binding protein [Coriobacteriia bacterium]